MLLRDGGFQQDVFRENRIDREVLLGMERSDTRELWITRLGDMMRLEKLQGELAHYLINCWPEAGLFPGCEYEWTVNHMSL